MLERFIEQKLVRGVKALNGICPKLNSQGMSGIPDRLVLLPKGKMCFVELKAPGKKPRALQLVQHKRLRELGFEVYVIDSVEQIDELLKKYGG